MLPSFINQPKTGCGEKVKSIDIDFFKFIKCSLKMEFKWRIGDIHKHTLLIFVEIKELLQWTVYLPLIQIGLTKEFPLL